MRKSNSLFKYFAIWFLVAAIAILATIVGFATIVKAEDEVYVVPKTMYVNLLDPAGGDADHLVIDPKGIWEGFGKDIEGASIIWAYADYQRSIAGARADLTTASGTYSVCTIFEVNDVEYLKVLNHQDLKVFNSFQTTCDSVEEWFAKELK